jgi:hypothetical protein
MKVKIKRVRGGSMGDQRNYGLVTGSIWNYENKTATNNVGTTLSPVPRDEATIEAERGETVIGDLDNDGMVEHAKIGGKRHSQGGTPLNVPDGSFVFSDYSKLRIKNQDLLKGIFNMSSKKPVTPAKVAQRYDINRYKQILNDPESDAFDKKTAQLMIDNNMKKLGQLALVQEGMKGFPDGIPAIAMPLMQTAPQSQGGQQKMRKGGVVKYRKGGLARYQGTENSEVVSDEVPIPMRTLPPSSDPNMFTPNPNNLSYIGEDPEYGHLFESPSGDRWTIDADGNWVKVLQGVEVTGSRTNPPSDFQMDFDGDGQVTMADYEAYEQYKQQKLQGKKEWNLSDQFQDPARRIFGVDNSRSDAYNLALGFTPIGGMMLASDINNNFVRPALYGEEEQPYESVLTEDYLNQKLAQNPSLADDQGYFDMSSGNPRMLSIPLRATNRDFNWWTPAIGAGALAAGALPRKWNIYKGAYQKTGQLLKGASDIFFDDILGPFVSAQKARNAGKALITFPFRPFMKRTWSDLQPLGMTKQPFWDMIRRKPFTPQPIVGPLTYVNKSPVRRFFGSKYGKLGILGAALGLGLDYFSDDIADVFNGKKQIDFGNIFSSSSRTSGSGNSEQSTSTVAPEVETIPYDMTELNINNDYQDSIKKSLKLNGVKKESTVNKGTTNQGSTNQKSTKELTDDEKLDRYLKAIGYSKERIDSMDREGKVYLYNRGKKPSDQIKKLGGENNLTTYKDEGEVNTPNRHNPDMFKYASQKAIDAARAKGYELTYAPYSKVYGDAAGSQINDDELNEVYVNTPNSFWIGGSDDPADMDAKVLAWYKDHPGLKDEWKNYPGGYDGWVKDLQLLSKYRNESSDWPEAYEKWAKAEGRQDPDEWLAETYDTKYYKPMTGEFYFNNEERDANGKLTVK